MGIGIYSSVKDFSSFEDYDDHSNYYPPEELNYNPTTPDVEDSLISGSESEIELNDAESALELADRGFESLDSFIYTLEAFKERGGMNSQTALMANRVIDQLLVTNFGIPTDYQTFSVEAFGNTDSKAISTTIAIEDLKSKSKEILSKAYEFIMKMIEKIKSVYQEYFGATSRLKKRAQKVKESLSDPKAKLDYKDSKLMFSYAQKFYLVTDKFKPKLESVGKVVDTIHQVMETFTSSKNLLTDFSALADGLMKMIEKAKTESRARKNLTKQEGEARKIIKWSEVRFEWGFTYFKNKKTREEQTVLSKFFTEETKALDGSQRRGEVGALYPIMPGGYMLVARSYKGDLLESASGTMVDTGEPFPSIQFKYGKVAQLPATEKFTKKLLPTNNGEVIKVLDRVIETLDLQDKAYRSVSQTVEEIKQKMSKIKSEVSGDELGITDALGANAGNKMFTSLKNMVTSLGTPITQLFKSSIITLTAVIEAMTAGVTTTTTEE